MKVIPTTPTAKNWKERITDAECDGTATATA